MKFELNNDWFYLKCESLNLHKRIYIAYSGGVDSSVLLFLLKNFKEKKKNEIKAIHINHSQNNLSKNWSNFCEKQCNKMKIPIYIYKNNENFIKNNIEEKLRIIRYNFFLKVIKKNSSLMLAHNENDNIETILINTFRGCGINTGIQETIKLNHINIIRPLINIDKKEIKNYAEKNKIDYVTDFSNFNKKFERNHIRYEILTKIKKRWPGFSKILKNNNKIQKNVYYLINILFKNFLNTEITKKKMPIEYLIKLPTFWRFEIIRRWIKENNKTFPSNKKMEELNSLITRETKEIKIKIDDYEIIKYKKNIYIKEKKLKKKTIFLVYKNIYLNKTKNKKIQICKKNKNAPLNYKYHKNKNIKYKKYIIYIKGLWMSINIIYQIIAKKLN